MVSFSSRTKTACAVVIEVISSTTVDRVPLADVGANRVDTDLTSVAWACLANAFIDIWNIDTDDILRL